MSRLGLRRRHGPSSHLLQTINGHQIPEPPAAAERAARSTTRKASPGINDAPLSSDDDSAATFQFTAGSETDDQSATPPQRDGSGSRGKRSARNPGAKRPRDGGNEVEEHATSSQMQDDFDFLTSSQCSKRVRRTNCYGGRNIHASFTNGRQQQRGRIPTQATSSKRSAVRKVERSEFRAPPSEEDMEAKLSSSPPKPDFKFLDDGLDDPSLLDEEKGLQFKLPEAIVGHELEFKKPPSGSTRATRRSRPTESQQPDDEPWRDVGGSHDDLLEELPESLRPLLKEPTQSSSALSSSAPSADIPLSTASDESSLTSPPDSQPSPPNKDSEMPARPSLGARCPMCKDPVQEVLLQNFSAGRRMNVNEQARFCRTHKEASARTAWTDNGYPQIDWANLRGRFEQFYPRLMDILSAKTESHYRRILEARIKTGKHRTLQQSLLTKEFAALTPGYYGSRGAQIMMNAIISNFSSEIRQLTASDKVISSSGPSAFVQAVLVPELALSLIKQDMNLEDEEAARTMLSESIEVGDLLNFEDDGGGVTSLDTNGVVNATVP